MKIQLLTRAAGPPGGLSGDSGSEHEVDETLGQTLVQAGAAVQVEASQPEAPKTAPSRKKKVSPDGSSPDNTASGRTGDGGRGSRRAKRSR